jgi:hypothetical protein
MSFVAVSIATAGIGALTSIGGGIANLSAAKKEQRRARRQNKRAKEEYQRQLEAYKNLDTSNPYLNMENVMEDLTINQKQAEFSRQQFAQSQANIMSGLREAAGGSGIAALAQSLAQQGQLASQRSAASIGQQEATNQRAERAMAGQLQNLERKGEVYSRGLKQNQTETLLAMAQQRRAAAMNRMAQAKTAKTAAIGGIIKGVGQAAIAGVQAGALANIFNGQGGGSIPSDITVPEGGGGRFLTDTNPTSLDKLQDTFAGQRRALNMGVETTKALGTPFEEAFRLARARHGGGGGTFEWPTGSGDMYTTNYRKEADEQGLAY